MTDRLVIMPTLPSKDKKKKILGAARRLLVRRGFQDIVLDDVAREAGVAKGTLFLYFKNKDDIFSAAFADLVDQMGILLDGLIASGKAGKPLLEETVRTILTYFERNKDFMSQFGAGRFPGCGDRSTDRLMEKLSLNMKRMVKILKLSAHPGLPEIQDPEYAASALFGLCRSAIVNRIVTGDHKPFISRTPKVIDMFLYGTKGKR